MNKDTSRYIDWDIALSWSFLIFAVNNAHLNISSKNEAYALAEKLSAYGCLSVALTGEDTQQRRADVITQLRSGELNYIITVDLFNEGIDTPEVNQVVMLRATTSSIIFVQQLGRGLRKSSNKDYVTVIDFIGNYKNNYLIPIALSEDPSYHKDNYRQFLTNSAVLNGVSTINFEEVTKKQIFESLTKATLNSVKILDDAYENVARRIGRPPLLMDFNDQNAIDPLIILEKYKNYHEFLEKRGYTTEVLEPDAFKNLTFLSREVAPGLKNTEHFILQCLIEGDARIAELLEYMHRLIQQ
ncbi:TPA: DEAD/DEAH box helicase [Staphylococcus pseudintermedius]